MKKIVNIVLIISIFLSSLMIVNATEYIVNIGVIKENGINIRSLPSTAGTVLDSINTGEKVLVLGEHPVGSGCTSNWLNIKYRGSYVGYICGDYVTRSTVTVASDDRFPASYQVGLAELKALHSNWVFEPINSELSFNTVVSEESAAFGKSLIQTSNDGWKHVDTYNFLTNTFNTNYSGGGSSWYAASPEITAYYVDPRNFLDEKRVFQFEQLAYNPTYHTLAGVQSMLDGTFMAGKPNKTAIDVANNLTYAEILLQAAATHGVSPYFLASRILQEVGNNGSVIVSGNYTSYSWGVDGALNNYFNFYNIGATGSSDGSTIIYNGIIYAKGKGWNNERDAIIGGASFVSNSYIAAGHDTQYLQKWDIIGPSYYTKQYMQNIQAPFSEAGRVYNNYNTSAMLKHPWVFRIPVYQNMPASSPLPATGSPNNYMKSVTVDSKGLVGFDPSITEYTVYVSKLKSELDISSLPIVTSAAITGNGKVPFTGATYRHELSVKAANGVVRKYYINFIRSNSDLVTLDDILIETKIPYDVTYIKNIPLNSTVDYLKASILKYESGVIITVKDINGVLKTTKLGTGDVITISLGSETKTLTNIRGGDLDGDGNITILDLLRTQRIILKTSNLSEVFVKAGDVNADGDVSIIDLLRVQKHILGMTLIE